MIDPKSSFQPHMPLETRTTFQPPMPLEEAQAFLALTIRRRMSVASCQSQDIRHADGRPGPLHTGQFESTIGGDLMFSLARLLRSCFAAVLLGLFCAGVAQAQKYVKLAPFPEASEELYGIGAGGKLYVFGGLGPDWTPK